MGNKPPQTSGWTTIGLEAPYGRAAPKYVINLDDAPKDRWNEIGTVYKTQIQQMLDETKKTLPEAVFALADTFGNELTSFLPPPYAEELRGLAEVTEIPVGELFLMNLSYDITAYCTSTVAQSCDGHLLHGRNFDMPSDPQYLATLEISRNATFFLDFQSGGKTVYSGVTTAGVIGLFTGQKPNSFTITIDERRTGSIWTNIVQLLREHPGSALGFLVRDALADPDLNYQGVLNRMTYIPMIAACYVIIAGTKPGDGAIITRGRLGPARPFNDGVWKLPRDGDSDDTWYLLVCNNDPWTRPPNLEPEGNEDLTKDSYKRQLTGNEAMKAMGQENLSPQNLIKTDSDALSKSPVLNPHTLYSIIMTASEPNLIKSWIRDKPETQESDTVTQESDTVTQEST